METVFLSHELSKQANSSSSKVDNNNLTPVESSNFTNQKQTMSSGIAPKLVKSPCLPKSTDDKNAGKSLAASSAPQDLDDESTTMQEKPTQKRALNMNFCNRLKRDLEKIGEDEITNKIRQSVAELKDMIEFTHDSLSHALQPLEMLKYTVCRSTQTSEERNLKCKWVDEMAKGGITAVFQKLISQTFELPFHEDEFNIVFQNMYAVLIVIWNGTDCSSDLCDAVIGGKIHKDLFRYLDHKVFLPENIENNKKATTMTKGFVGILNNLLQKCDVMDAYRQCDGVRIIEKFVHSKNVMMKCKAFMVLSYIINEEENEKINSDDSIFKFLLKILDDTLKTDSHVSRKYGYRTEEIIETLNRLAANDANRERMLKHDVINYYTRLMSDDNKSNPHEQALAARGIWTFAFKDKDRILSTDGCVDALKSLSQKSENSQAREQAKGALWILDGKHQDMSSPVDKPKDDKDIPHVMISYQWDNQKVMLRVRDRLQKAGFKVWMDVDKMSGLVLEAMADAIENAAVVLVSMSQKYKESPNCRTEGDYAFAKRKPIIPLKLQYKYEPDGWLGALIGSMLFFDFSREQKFERSLDGLIKELGNRGRTGVSQVVTASMNVSNDMARPPTFSEVTSKSRCTEWDTKKVASWLQENGLQHLVHSFSEIDGALLDEYKLMYRDAPEFFYKTLDSSLKLSLPEILKFTKVLRTL